jgi:hypothetical protein
MSRKAQAQAASEPQDKPATPLEADGSNPALPLRESVNRIAARTRVPSEYQELLNDSEGVLCTSCPRSP